MALLGLAVIAALAMAGCGSDSKSGDDRTTSTSASAKVGDTLTLVTSLAPVSIDPMKNTNDPPSTWFTQIAYEPLIRLGLGGELSPGIATSWQYVGEGNRKFELKIRQDAKFADGTPVTAESVAASIRYWMRNGINAAAWGGPFDKVTVVDPETVTISFRSPYPVAAEILTDVKMSGSVISAAGLKNPKALGHKTFGAGPYMLDGGQTVGGDHYTFVPNPNYWEKDRIHWKRIVIKVIPDNNSALQAVQTGQADLMLGDANSLATARSGGLTVTQGPAMVQGLTLADRGGEVVPALRDVRVRQALNHAIDRQAIADALYPGAATPTAQTAGPGFSDFDPALDEAYPYDVEKAKELLADAGYADGFTMSLGTPTTFNLPQLVQAVVSQWERIGVKTKVTTEPNVGKWFGDTIAKKHPTYILHYNFIPAYFQANSLYQSANVWNAFDSRDEQLSELVARASAEVDPDAQADLWQQAAKRFSELAWDAPVVRGEAVFVSSRKISGVEFDAPSLTPNPLNIVPAS